MSEREERLSMYADLITQAAFRNDKIGLLEREITSLKEQLAKAQEAQRTMPGVPTNTKWVNFPDPPFDLEPIPASGSAELRPEPNVMMHWKPIDTALKDGTKILLVSKPYEGSDVNDAPISHASEVHIGCWNPEVSSWVDECGSFDGDAHHLAKTGIWNSGYGWFQPNDVTHWMPLPEPPAVQTLQSNGTEDGCEANVDDAYVFPMSPSVPVSASLAPQVAEKVSMREFIYILISASDTWSGIRAILERVGAADRIQD